jgi:multidrug efflux pump subunit AcrB
MTQSPHKTAGLIAWFAANPVAANLLMLLILLGGAGALATMEREVFPRFSPHQLQVTARMPGVGPREIETAVCVRIEEAIYNAPGVKRLKTEISQGECKIKVAVLPDHDKEAVMASVRGRIQAIPRLPKELERVEVEPASRNDDDGVIWVALHGRADPLAMRRLGDSVQEDLSRIDGVTRAVNYNEIPYEIAIEVSPAKLRQFELSLGDVAQAVRRASLDLPGGLVKSPSGEVLLQVKGKAGDAEALGRLPLRSGADGALVRLADVAAIRDGLEERVSEWRHNGETGQGWEVHAEHDTVDVARRVKAYVEAMRTRLPAGVAISTWWDDSTAFDERVQTLLEDGLSGFVLVLCVLTLFLKLRVAFWAGAGILTSVFGAFWLMPWLGVSLNMLSLFGFLLAMGILVDDAIIVGEAVYARQEGARDQGPGTGENPAGKLEATIDGVHSVALPVVLAVLVALVAFLPGLFLPGWAGQMMKPICLVMILTLLFSLVEALLILPAHLAAPSTPAKPSRLDRLRGRLNAGLDGLVERYYRPFLLKALEWRGLTVALFLVLLMLCTALVAGGWVRQSLRADVTKDTFFVILEVPPGLPYDEIRQLAERTERALFKLRDDMDSQLAPGHSIIVNVETMVWERMAGLWVEFSPEGRRRVAVEDFIRAWRAGIGDIGRAHIDFHYKEGDDTLYDLEFDLAAADPASLTAAAERLKRALAAFPGVFDVMDTAEPGKPEARLALKPGAERLGLRLEDLAQQARAGYFGEEVQRLQRGRQEVKLMVRLPLEERQSLDRLRQLPVRLPDGALAPLGSVADVALLPGYAKLVRQDRRRVLKVQARVDPQRADANALYAQLESGELESLRRDFPGLSVEVSQERQDEEAMGSSLVRNTLVSLLVIYALIAVPFRSYLKPLIFLLAAPVAWSGAVLAHWAAGLPLSMESLVGMIAASGVVVNDSLVLLDYLRPQSSAPSTQTSSLILEACSARFRPILLAFLTNFAGFLPTLLETSVQAQFLIPMTLSLSAGLLVGMAASLVLTPVCYALLEENA